MNEPQKNLWKQPWRGSKALAWMGLVAAATFVLVLVFGGVASGQAGVVDSVLAALSIAVVLAVVSTLLLLFLRWLFCWRNFKRFLFGVACLLTLIAIAFVVENIRGHYAWKDLQEAAAAKGERMDLAGAIPPPVPDADNFAMAPIFEGVRNEMNPEYRRAHMGPGGLTNVNRFVLSPYRTNNSSDGPGIGGWMEAKQIDLRAWQSYYRTSRVENATGHATAGTPEATNTTNTVVYEFPVAPQPQSPAADVLLALSKHDQALEGLREAARRPHSRFPLRYEDTFNTLLPHLAKMKAASQFLALRAVAELDAGQPEQALADVRLSLRLVESLESEGFLISHLVRVANTFLTLQPIWEGLADRRWNDAQLAALDADLGRVDFLSDYGTAIRGERVCAIEAVDYVRRTRDRSLFSDGGDPSGAASKDASRAVMLLHLVPNGWFDQNKALIGRLNLDLFVPNVDTARRVVSPAKVRQNSEALQQALAHRTPYNIFAGMLLPAVSRLSEKFARGQAGIDLARVAIALERYRLAQGAYPEKLDALTPQFLAQLPHDIINGQPIHYRRTDDGQFLLYEVGWDETDEGGKVGLTSKGNPDWGKGDWVWRYPAK